MAILMIISWAVVLLTIFTIAGATATRVRKPTIAHDGHVIKPENDITCETKYGHKHDRSAEPKDYIPASDPLPSLSSDPSRRYIVHEEPVEGYVVLNGVKRKIEDCKYY